jgi:putative Holliday junction resolvase
VQGCDVPDAMWSLCYPAIVRALGIDYGERRIGLALSDATGLLASPWKTLEHGASVKSAARDLVDEVRRLKAEEAGLGAIVIGLPRRLSGEPNAQTARAQELAQLIAAALDVPVSLQDERLTSHEADALLARSERDWRQRKKHIDAMAAALILQDYLDSRPRPLQPPSTDPA